MEFKAEREALVKELSVIRAAVEKRITIPALAFALFEVSNGALKIIGTDLDVTIITSLPVKGSDGVFCVPAIQLLSLLRLFTDDQVTFSVEKNERIKVTCGQSKHFLPTMKREQFPAVGETKTGEKAMLPADVLRGMVKAALLAVSTETNDQRPHCLSLNLAADKGVLEITGTTEKHLLNTSYAMPKKVSFDVMLPRRAAQVLVAFAEGEKIGMEISESQAVFTSEHRKMIARLALGKYVAWRIMIPDVDGHKARVPVGGLQSAIKRAAITMEERYVGFRFEFSKNNLTVESRGAQSVEPVAVDCPSLNGDTWEVGVHGWQVLDFLNAVDSENVFCEVFPPKVNEKEDGTKTEWPRPIRFTPVTQGEFNLQYFTQPVRLD